MNTTLRVISIGLLLLGTLSASAFFDPTIGRWASRDPIAERGGGNVYGYVGNRSPCRVDRLGKVGLVSIGSPAATPDWTYGFAGVWFVFDAADAAALGGNGSLIWHKTVSYDIQPCNTAVLSWQGTRSMWFKKDFSLDSNGSLVGGFLSGIEGGGRGLDLDVFSINIDQVIQQHQGGSREWSDAVRRCGSMGKITSDITWTVGPQVASGGAGGSLDGNLWGFDHKAPHAEPAPPQWEFRGGVISQGILAARLEWNSCIRPLTGSLRVFSSLSVQPGGRNRPGKRPQEGHLVEWEGGLR